jgi:hypothetical protein
MFALSSSLSEPSLPGDQRKTRAVLAAMAADRHDSVRIEAWRVFKNEHTTIPFQLKALAKGASPPRKPIR